MPPVKPKEVVSVARATELVAGAEQRHTRACEALAAAIDEELSAKHELNVARRALRDANRRQIEEAKR